MRINRWVSSIADAGRELLNRGQMSRSPSQPKTIDSLCAALFSNKGEALGTALAGEVASSYSQMDAAEKRHFFQLLMDAYGPDPTHIGECTRRYLQRGDIDTFRALSQAVEPPRQRLLRRINMAPGGTRTIVDMRADLLPLCSAEPALQIIDDDLSHLLASWFNPGFLKLKRIDWSSPATVLEKLIAYEAVHEMKGWEDLRRRLDNRDRRCFGFFHPALPQEPLIFVEVALVNGIAGSVQSILSPAAKADHAGDPDAAIFYSISNCQAGLKGISFGNFLIKQVVMRLKEEFPPLIHFATLSPIPGFMRWLNALRNQPQADSLLSPPDLKRLESLDAPDWHPAGDEGLKPLLRHLCCHYLYHEKRGIQPIDPVARFHLGNGASIARLNWLGDSSDKGIRQSAGILVNYRYDLHSVEANHEAFLNDGAIATTEEFLSDLPVPATS